MSWNKHVKLGDLITEEQAQDLMSFIKEIRENEIAYQTIHQLVMVWLETDQGRKVSGRFLLNSITPEHGAYLLERYIYLT